MLQFFLIKDTFHRFLSYEYTLTGSSALPSNEFGCTVPKLGTLRFLISLNNQVAAD